MKGLHQCHRLCSGRPSLQKSAVTHVCRVRLINQKACNTRSCSQRISKLERALQRCADALFRGGTRDARSRHAICERTKYLLACLRHSASCRYGSCKGIRFKSSLVGFVRAARGAAIWTRATSPQTRHAELDDLGSAQGTQTLVIQ